jgi:hypothetical protein
MGIGGCRLEIKSQKLYFELRETAARFPPPEPIPLWDELKSIKRKYLTGGGLDLAA